MIRLHYFLLLILFLLCGNAVGQNYYFKTLDREDGLSHNMVYDILQDHQGFIWAATQKGLNRYDGVSFRVFRKEPDKGNGLTDDSFFALAEDKEGIIWVGTSDGLFTYNPASEVFTDVELRDRTGNPVRGVVQDLTIDALDNVWIAMGDNNVFRMSAERRTACFSLSKSLSEGGKIRGICSDRNNDIWIATDSDGLFRLNPDTGDTMNFRYDDAKRHSADFSELLLLDNETLLVGTGKEGVLKFNLRFHRFEPLDQRLSDAGIRVHDLFKDRDGNLWIGAETGLYSLSGGQLLHFTHIANDPYSIAGTAVYAITSDREGGLWIGTYFGGISYYSEYSSQFEKYYPGSGPGRLSGQNITQFHEDGKGGMWVATEDGGLSFFDLVAKTFTPVKGMTKNIHALETVDGKLWIGTYGDGVYTLDPTARIPRKLRASFSLPEDNIFSIYQDFESGVWLGTDKGLYKYNRSLDRFQGINAQNITTQVNDILEDFSGNMWFATMGEGIFKYDSRRNIWQNFSFEGSGGKSVICMMEDADHNLWVGTDGAGIFFFDMSRGAFTNHYTAANGLPDGVIYKLLGDSAGNVWGSTNHGVFRFHPKTEEIQEYTMESGLLYDQYNYNSGLYGSDGKMYFGGVEGFVAFDPINLKRPNYAPAIIFNHFRLLNADIEVGGEDSPIDKSITLSKEIVLKPRQTTFSIGFADLSYAPSPEITYSYRMAGLDKEWIDLPEPQAVTYTKLPPGNYRFEVRANDSGSPSGPVSSIAIKVLPPFYMTTTAFFVYLLLLSCAIYWISNMILKRMQLKNRKIMEEMEAEKEKELYDSKIEFFTNITHEIRTPLTLITVPLDEVLDHTDKGDPEYEKLSIVRRNSARLLKLVNELLDFKKIGSDELKLNYVRTDVARLVGDIITGFVPNAAAKGIQFETVLSPDGLEADIDKEIVTKILSNLFSNASKHARSRIVVQAAVSGDRFRILVSNDGDPIPAGQAERIFAPFVKLDVSSKGSGIGLPFARTLAESHGGVLFLDKKQELATFVLELPLRQTSVMVSLLPDDGEPLPVQTDDTEPANGDAASRPVILLVDDNEEFRAFMADHLKNRYAILSAQDGAQGLEMLQNHPVDLVISDVMMPVMDGIRMCRTIKDDLQFSHIPVILLTAKTDMGTKIEGLNVGADEYVTKPFSSDYLRARIENLLTTRDKIRKAYMHSPELSVETITHSKTDEVFMNKLIEVINGKIENTALDVDEVAAAMYMSRATLYRKLKGVSELSPNDFIRLCRLKKAAQLLREREYKINEIAYIVGFNSPSYFSKCFAKQFGVLPKDFT